LREKGWSVSARRVTDKNGILLIGGHTICRRILTVDDGLKNLDNKRSIAALVAPARSLAARREKMPSGARSHACAAFPRGDCAVEGKVERDGDPLRSRDVHPPPAPPGVRLP
jgi:hypothetical protein